MTKRGNHLKVNSLWTRQGDLRRLGPGAHEFCVAHIFVTAVIVLTMAQVLKKGSNECVRAMVSSRPSQNQKRKTRAAETEEGKTVCNCLKVMI